MKKILSILAFLPTVVFANCVDLTGSYVCSIEVNAKTINVGIELQTIGNRYIVKNLETGAINDWVADGHEVRKVTPGVEGEILSSRTLSCSDKEVRLISMQAWWHEGEVSTNIPADVKKLLIQTYVKDADGNLLQKEHYVEYYGGIEKLVQNDLTVCTKVGE